MCDMIIMLCVVSLNDVRWKSYCTLGRQVSLLLQEG